MDYIEHFWIRWPQKKKNLDSERANQAEHPVIPVTVQKDEEDDSDVRDDCHSE